MKKTLTLMEFEERLCLTSEGEFKLETDGQAMLAGLGKVPKLGLVVPS